MRVRGSLAAALSLIVCALVGCAAPNAAPEATGEGPADDPAAPEAADSPGPRPETVAGTGEPGDERPEEQEDREPLTITVDAVDLFHGALRMIATMDDGAADVTVRLGDCDHRPVGGGVSTLSTLVWSFGDKDLADAIGCGLHVRARARDGTGYVSKVADLPVGLDVSPLEGVNPDDGPTIQSVTPTEDGLALGFTQVSPARTSSRATASSTPTRPTPRTPRPTTAAPPR